MCGIRYCDFSTTNTMMHICITISSITFDIVNIMFLVQLANFVDDPIADNVFENDDVIVIALTL